MKARLADMEKEATKLKEAQDKAKAEAGLAPAAGGSGSVDQVRQPQGSIVAQAAWHSSL